MSGYEQRKSFLRSVLREVLQAVNPASAVDRHFKDGRIVLPRRSYDLNSFENLYLITGGKAAFSTLRGVKSILDRFEKIVIAGTGYKTQLTGLSGNMEIFHGDHPFPDRESLRAGKKILSTVEAADSGDLVFFLLSGGFSSLAEVPERGVDLADIVRLTASLMNRGADIKELNTVRKKLSKIKGGKTAQKAYPATLITLIVSDVPGDNPAYVGSGPTVPDWNPPVSASEVIEIYDLDIPAKIRECLNRQDSKSMNSPSDPNRIRNRIILSNKDALRAVKKTVRNYGFEVEFFPELKGEAKEKAKTMMTKIEGLNATSRGCFAAGGETSVTVSGDGKGGRNTEFALASSLVCAGSEDIYGITFGTDGIDGNTKAAGAYFDGSTLKRAGNRELDPQIFLDNNDSGTFFKKLGDLLITGHTGTNVMDVVVIVKEKA